MAKQLNKSHKDLYSVIKVWVKTGQEADFEFEGVTLVDIIEKENASYIQAIFTMDALLASPEIAKEYKSFELKWI